MFLWIFFLVLILLLVGSSPTWPYSRGWGYGPALLVLALLVLLVLAWMFGWMPMWMHNGWHGPMHGSPAK